MMIFFSIPIGNLKPEAMECDECEYRCDLMTQLNCHKQIVHKDGEIPFACNLCPQQVSFNVES